MVDCFSGRQLLLTSHHSWAACHIALALFPGAIVKSSAQPCAHSSLSASCHSRCVPPGDERWRLFILFGSTTITAQRGSYSTSSSYTQDTERSFAAAEPQPSPPPQLQPELEERTSFVDWCRDRAADLSSALYHASRIELGPPTLYTPRDAPIRAVSHMHLHLSRCTPRRNLGLLLSHDLHLVAQASSANMLLTVRMFHLRIHRARAGLAGTLTA